MNTPSLPTAVTRDTVTVSGEKPSNPGYFANRQVIPSQVIPSTEELPQKYPSEETLKDLPLSPLKQMDIKEAPPLVDVNESTNKITADSLIESILKINTMTTHPALGLMRGYPLNYTQEQQSLTRKIIENYSQLSEDLQKKFWVRLWQKDAKLARYLLHKDEKYMQSFLSHSENVYHTLLQEKSRKCLPPNLTNIPVDAPVNFIWLGSLLPDKYLKNIKKVARCTPNREIILWKDRNLLNTQNDSQMNRLTETDELKKLNVIVLDVNDIKFDELLPETSKNFRDEYHWITRTFKEYAAASDLLRYGLLAMGSKAINSAAGDRVKLNTSAMIYMDTDRGPIEESSTDWGELRTPAGFSYPGYQKGNDCLTAAYENHPVFEKSVEDILSFLSDDENKQFILYHKEKGMRKRVNNHVINHFGPGVLYDSVIKVFGTCSDLTERPMPEDRMEVPGTVLSTPAIGPENSDWSWTELDPSERGKELDLSATWIKQLEDVIK